MAIQETIADKGSVTFDDVAGLEEAKQTLREAIVIPLQFPHLFTGFRKPWKRILLYGPPGTGKTRLAQALSSAIESTFYCVSSSNLISSWLGESEKLIKELFENAQAKEGRSVIFIDEIDSLCRKRISAEQEHTRRVKTEFLKQMEGADSSDRSDKIFLLCATNCPWELDPAFLRRFQKRIFIPLPDRDARHSLMKIHTKDNEVMLTESDWQELADKTEGYSGSDIATLVLGALMEPIRHMQKSPYWRYKPDGTLIPCENSVSGAFRAQLLDLPPDQVRPRDVILADFLYSLSIHGRTVSSDDLQQFTTFTSHFGQSG